MAIFNAGKNGNSPPFQLSGGGRFLVARKEFVPAYVRAYEEPLNSAPRTQSKRCAPAAFVRAIARSTITQ